MDDDSLIAVALCLSLDKPRKKRKWSKEWYLKRNSLSHVKLMKELHFEPCDWTNYLRMSESAYKELLHLVTPLIEKQNTNMRNAISPNERLSATLRFLATGNSYKCLRFSTAISSQSLSIIISETCRAIITVLKNYIKMPANENDWKKIAEGFKNRWQFPNCLGAVDGKHVCIIPPAGSGSLFWNYKKFNSIVLMAIVDSNYEFIMCDVGTNGGISDGGVINNTMFYEKLLNNDLQLPPDDTTACKKTQLPYVFVGDEAFTLRRNFLKPFNKKQLNYENMVFNYRLSRARRIVENAFGILSSRFQIFHSAINFKNFENVDVIILACCYLHNFLRRKSINSYTPSQLNELDRDPIIDVQGLVQLQVNNSNNNAVTREAKACRNKYVDYFLNEGKTDWQDEVVRSRYMP